MNWNEGKCSRFCSGKVRDQGGEEDRAASVLWNGHRKSTVIREDEDERAEQIRWIV